ncbi:hypothetical protein PUN28_008022 [Cardiocondyla obscurior]|uniref:CHK kinase-like domain-containing protein n=2 Tax=Cardiocondyla obscurior TaxID=286306 RepID=A0AAW2FXW1_9HYME
MSDDGDFQNWMKDSMSKIIEILGLNADETRYAVTKSTGRFMSVINYVRLQFKNKKTERAEELFMILKKPLQTYPLNDSITLQFHNEILFYQTYVQPGENYARCFYVDERPPTDSVIALEDVNKRGYQPCPYTCNAPLEYILAAMREIGRFHGKGYATKKLHREKFIDIATRLREARYFEAADNPFEIICNVRSTEAIEYLRGRGYDAVFCDKMEPLLKNAFEEVMMKISEPREPLSTLCHGDFTLDNILFEKKDDGQIRAMLIDFAFLKHSTPVVDLSTFLCLSCSNEIMKDKFHEIIRAYHDALKECLLEAGVWDAEIFSYEALLDDYKRGALFGYVIACFYLPTLLGYHKIDEIKERMLHLGVHECMKQLKYNDEVRKILADMLLIMKDFGCLKHFAG